MFVTLQVSAPYMKTDFTFVVKILSLVLKDISLDLHTGLSRRNAVLALPILSSVNLVEAKIASVLVLGCVLG